MKPKIYLGGPIGGESYEAANGWREEARSMLRAWDIVGLNPLRGEEFLAGQTNLDDHAYTEPLATSRGIVTRDRFDCRRCDVALFNLLGAKKSGQGTFVEMGWADAYGKPIIVVIEKEGNPFDGLFLREMADYVAATLEEALSIAVTLIE